MIGIDISDRSIKVVEIGGKNSDILRTVCWSPMAPNLIRRGVIQDVLAVTDAVKKAMTKCSPMLVSGDEVVASIPEVQSFVRVLDLPPMADREINEAVQWAVRRHIPFDPERVYLDWESLGGGALKNRQVLVGAAQRDVIDPLLAVLDKLELNVVGLELEAQAVLRCLLPRNSKEAMEVRGVLVVDLGATSTNVIFFDEGAMRYTSSIQMGGDDLTQYISHELKITAGEAAELKVEVGVGVGEDATSEVSTLLKAATMQLIHQIEKTVKEMAIQLPAERNVKAILLSGGGANLPGIQELFGSVFSGLPVQKGNVWTNIKRDEGKVKLSADDALHFTTALGSALRAVEYS